MESILEIRTEELYQVLPGSPSNEILTVDRQQPFVTGKKERSWQIALFCIDGLVMLMETSISAWIANSVGQVSAAQGFATFTGTFLILINGVILVLAWLERRTSLAWKNRWTPERMAVSTLKGLLVARSVILLMSTLGLLSISCIFYGNLPTLWAATFCHPCAVTACERDYGVTAFFYDRSQEGKQVGSLAPKDYNEHVKMIAIWKLAGLLLEMIGTICGFAATYLSIKRFVHLWKEFRQQLQDGSVESNSFHDPPSGGTEEYAVMAAEHLISASELTKTSEQHDHIRSTSTYIYAAFKEMFYKEK